MKVPLVVAASPLFLVLLLSCRDQVQPPGASATTAPEVPVSSPGAIPDAPVSGTISGAPFVVRDARYVVDRRVGYAHTDIRLSAAKADSPCGTLDPPKATSVWLRLDGPDRMTSRDLRLGAGDDGPWSVHYQVFDGEQWKGASEGNALLSILEPSPDGRLAGGLAVCFADGARSCVMGSFEATSCPQRIDEPVRGAVAPEVLKEKH